MENPLQFLGIDVSKRTLDVCTIGSLGREHLEIGNDRNSIELFFKNRDNRRLRVCFENTGRYNWILMQVLTEMDITYYQVNPIHLKRSMGLVRGKDDVVDSYRIAMFVSRNHQDLTAHRPLTKDLLKIKVLLAKRALLVRQRAQHKVAQKEDRLLKGLDLEALERYTNAFLVILNEKIKEIELMIRGIVRRNESLGADHRIITSMPGVGEVVSWNILVKTNAFSNIVDPRKFACYAGVAPFSHQSGSSIYKRPSVSHYADKAMKRLLHLAAMRAVQLDNDLKEHYIRKTNEGKNKMLVLNAVRNKIILRIFAMVKSRKKYQMNLDMS